MASLIAFFFLIILIIPFLMIINIKYDSRVDHIKIGFIMIEYSRIDKICYSVALVSLFIGVVVGISMIWIEDIQKIAAKVMGSFGLMFVLCLGVLILNRLIRASGRFKEKKTPLIFNKPALPSDQLLFLIFQK